MSLGTTGTIGMSGVNVGCELVNALFIGHLQVTSINSATFEWDMREILAGQRAP
jgi:hypothetical protein